MKTAFEKICLFNKLIGNKCGDVEMLVQQLQMVKEEFEELCAAVHALDMKEIRDGVADVLVTVYGLAFRAGINADSDLEAVYRSNMSKFVNWTEEDAIKASWEVHNRLHISVDYIESAPGIWAIRSLEDQTGADGKQYPKGKLLKPSTYVEPEFK